MRLRLPFFPRLVFVPRWGFRLNTLNDLVGMSERICLFEADFQNGDRPGRLTRGTSGRTSGRTSGERQQRCFDPLSQAGELTFLEKGRLEDP